MSGLDVMRSFTNSHRIIHIVRSKMKLLVPEVIPLYVGRISRIELISHGYDFDATYSPPKETTLSLVCLGLG